MSNISNPQKIYWKEIMKRAKKLKKENKIQIGVTNIIRLNQCPMQAVLYSSISPFRLKPSIAFTIGSLAHAFFDIYYDCAENTEAERILALARDRMKADHYGTPEKWKFYTENKNKIDAEAIKYFRTFINWAKMNPKPYLRETLYHYGFVEGIIDRIDKFGAKFMLTDYKTASSIPNEERLMQYKTQLGGYLWLLNKVNPHKWNQDTFLPPRILIIRAASWKTIAIHNWKYYMEDFDGLVQTAAKILIKLVKGKIPEASLENNCRYSCLSKQYCLAYQKNNKE